MEPQTQLPDASEWGLIAVVARQLSVVSDSFFLARTRATPDHFTYMFLVRAFLVSVPLYPLPVTRYQLLVRR